MHKPGAVHDARVGREIPAARAEIAYIGNRTFSLSPNMLNLTREIRESLDTLGISGTEETPSGLAVETNLLRFHVAESEQHLRFECRLVEGVQRNKLALWNVIHHNNAFVPFGQFYISPDNNVCFGFRIAAEESLRPWFGHMMYQLMQVGEAYYRVVCNDFQARPFEEDDMQMDALSLFRTELVRPDEGGYQLSQADVVEMLERQLAEIAGPENVMRISEREFALTATEFPLCLTLEQLPSLLRAEEDYGWLIGMHTEVGMLRKTNDRLWVYLNRQNYSSFLLSHTINYSSRRPMLTLKSSLIPALIQQPELVRRALEQHFSVAPALFEELQSPYAIQNMVDYKLGL